jgi:hypothetical protein
MNPAAFETDGYLVTSPLFSGDACRVLDSQISSMTLLGPGSRSLLEHAWCTKLARELREHPALSQLLPATFVATQCTLFEKSLERNWLVALHQDLSIPVAEKIAHPTLSGWSEKEGTIFVQAPMDVLHQLIAVRLHVDGCTASDGALRVVPGSHLQGRANQSSAQALKTTSGELVCPVLRGGAMLMRPLLLHASSKTTGHSKRRVLHFLFGPPSLPLGLRWQHAI